MGHVEPEVQPGKATHLWSHTKPELMPSSSWTKLEEKRISLLLEVRKVSFSASLLHFLALSWSVSGLTHNPQSLPRGLIESVKVRARWAQRI